MLVLYLTTLGRTEKNENKLNPNPSRGCGTIIGLALPAVVICRLILNLQELPSAAAETEEQDTTSGAFTTHPSRLWFSLKNLKGTFFEEQWGTVHYDLSEES
ncbi:hypothetical protein Clacol_005205 [Clathrus columnatus]|uniref:Uncharacterized protein n=1 Tax=Clathrus columnatus TaxID=1419009 RepID=A0AAV5AD95_9AGAM|nr:hypothetical protein Clacol_005205 [Clathrus columnatus]